MIKSETRANILLVDDIPANLLALEAVLERLGQNLVKVVSGEDVVKHIIQKDFAVILLDIRMPGINGFETAALIRQNDRSRNTPIIFLTALQKGEMEMSESYAVGVLDYMVKPFDPAELRSKVSVLIGIYHKMEKCRLLNEELNRKIEELRVLNLSLMDEIEMSKRT